jgi:outer membrane protein TolC
MHIPVLAFLALFAADPASSAPPLTLAEAVVIAQQTAEPSIEAFEARALAAESRGRAADTRPDPVISAGLTSVPTTDMNLNREPMSQARLGLRQMFPRGDSRRLDREQQMAEARALRANGDRTARMIQQSVREAWLEMFYVDRATELTRARLQAVRDLAEMALSAYSTGRQNSHDVTRIGLESSMLEARLIDLERQREQGVADLSRHLPAAAARRPLPAELPVLPVLPDAQNVTERLIRHPEIMAHNARIDAHEAGVGLARQAFRPAWALEAGYGVRGSRSDLANVGVSVQVPLFDRTRQTEGVASARDLRHAAELERDAALLEFRRQFERELAQLRRLQESAEIYNTAVIPQAQETAAAVLLAYQEEQADFAELIRSELAHLDAQLVLLRIRVDALKAQSRLLYLTGDF